MSNSPEGKDCVSRAVALALGDSSLVDQLWALRDLQRESGRATVTNPEGEAEHIAALFRAAGSPTRVDTVAVRSLKHMKQIFPGDQLFAGLPGEVTGRPHLMYIGTAGGKDFLDAGLMKEQLPPNLAVGFVFTLIKLYRSDEGLRLFIRRTSQEEKAL